MDLDKIMPIFEYMSVLQQLCVKIVSRLLGEDCHLNRFQSIKLHKYKMVDW